MGRLSLSSSSGDDEHGDLAEINIIPLVDIMLVLLIIFMVAAPLSISGIGVNLPQSKASGVSIDQTRIILSVSAKGGYFIDKANILDEHLEARMQAIFAVREKKELYIRADKAVPYGKVIEAMSAAKLAGVQKISMLTTPKDSTSKI